MTASPFKYLSVDDCPDVKKHTKRPTGYLEFQEWADEKALTHQQERCPTCGYWAMWKKKGKDGA